MTTIAIMAILSTVSSVIDNPLVKRLLKNLSEKTTNTIDDWVIAALYGATQIVPKTAVSDVVPAMVALGQIQAKYDEVKKTAETTGDYTGLHRLKEVKPITGVAPWMETAPPE